MSDYTGIDSEEVKEGCGFLFGAVVGVLVIFVLPYILLKSMQNDNKWSEKIKNEKQATKSQVQQR